LGLRHYFRVAALITIGLIVGLSATSCAAPQYTYVADYGDNSYFKVPPNWHQVNQNSLQSLAGPSINGVGNYLWARGYDSATNPAAQHVLAFTTPVPVVFAGVLSLSSGGRSALSLNAMRDLFLPVTSTTRQAAAQAGAQFTGFKSESDQVITDSHGDRGINEIFDYTFNGLPETFDLTVMTDSNTTKLYFLMVQCLEPTFASDYSQISQVVGSFTVGGGS
jgi:hypothetical protein